MTTVRAASLGMYDLPPLQKANDALWRGIAGWLRDHGVDGVPQQLERERPLAQIWDDPELLLAQTCGLPLVTRWRDRLRYVATPIYAASGCEGPSYRSVLVVSRDSAARDLADLRGTTVAINEALSNSGCNLLAAAVAPLGASPFFAAALLTGSHLASAQAVAEGGAALAAIDVVSWAHLSRHHPELAERLRPLGWTPSAPALPFVTSADAPDDLVALLRQALAWAGEAAELRGARDTLLLKGFAQVPMADYAALATLTAAGADDLPAFLASRLAPALWTA